MEDLTYDEFINNILETRGRFACGDEYHERHHIVPRCMNGTDDEDNLIDLFGREHFVAHKLLAKEHPDNKSLTYAWYMMSTMGNSRECQISPEEYEEARIKYIASRKGVPLSEETRKKLSASHKGIQAGEKNPNYGKPTWAKGKHFSEEHRKKIGDGNRGKVHSEELRKRRSEIAKERLSNPENHPMFGKRHTEEARKKQREAKIGKHTGDDHHGAIKLVQLTKEDTYIQIWSCAKQAGDALHIAYQNIHKCCLGERKSAGDFHWKYLYDNTKKDGAVVSGAISLGYVPEEIINWLHNNNNVKENVDAI